MFVLAQIISLFALLANVVGIQLKKKQHILFSFIIAATFFTISFILLGAYSGAVICAIAGVQTVTNYIFERRQRKFPNWLTMAFIVISIIGGIATYHNIYDILPVIGAIAYILSIVQTQESRIRKITLFTLVLWIVYDIIVAAYVTVAGDAMFFISAMIAIVRYDIMGAKIKKTDSSDFQI
jgi:hypothetical protein